MTKSCRNGHIAPERYANGRCKLCRRATRRRWKETHPASVRVEKRSAKARRRIGPGRQPAWASVLAIREIYRRAAEQRVTVDHVVPLRGHLVCGLHCEANLRLLPALDNSKKSNYFDPQTYTHELPIF